MEHGEPLPAFPYYPQPNAKDGSVERSNLACRGCGQKRGYVCEVFQGLVTDPFCPWCIAGGTAQAFGVEFNQVDWDQPVDDEASRAEVIYRTPGILTSQDGLLWPAHCGDMAIYRGKPSGKQLRESPAMRSAFLRLVAEDNLGDETVEDVINNLGSNAATYVFQCRHCGETLVPYWDAD